MTAATTRRAKPRPVKRKTGKRSASPKPLPALAEQVRGWANELGRMPSQREVRDRFRIGQDKARDVVAEAARSRLRLVDQTAPEDAPPGALGPAPGSALETAPGSAPETAPPGAPKTASASALEGAPGDAPEPVREPHSTPLPEPDTDPAKPLVNGGTGPAPDAVLSAPGSAAPSAPEGALPEPAAGALEGALQKSASDAHSGAVPTAPSSAPSEAGPGALPKPATVASTERWGGSYLVTDRDPAEAGRDRAVDHQIRQAWRDERHRAALAEAGRHRREAQAHDQIADQHTDDRVWQARAVSEVERHTGAAAYIVALVKMRRTFTWICLALLVAGTGWGAVNAHTTMVHTVAKLPVAVNVAFYLVDPLVTVLLVGLLWVRSVVSARGESLGSWALVAIEIALLATTVILNAGPYLPIFGHFSTPLAAFGHVVPAGVVTLTVLSYPIVDRLTAVKLRAARAELGGRR